MPQSLLWEIPLMQKHRRSHSTESSGKLCSRVQHIDLAAARQRGLIVTNTPDVLTDALRI